MRHKYILLGTVLTGLLSGSLYAQETLSTPAEKPANKEMGDRKSKVPAVAAASVALGDGHPTITAKLPELASDPRLSGIPLETVVIQGLASSSVETEKGRNVAVDWYAVATEDGKKVAPLSDPLKGSFRSTESVVPAGAKLPAKGNVDGLVEAIRSMFPKDGDGAGGQAGEDEARRRGQASTQGAPSAGPTAGGNDIASGFKSLNSQPVADRKPENNNQKGEEEAVTYGTTQDGCPPRVDLVQEFVVQQSADTQTKAGVVTRGECTDTEKKWTIKYSQSECLDEVVLSENKAYPRHRPYYVNDLGKAIYLDVCRRIPEVAYDIKPDPSACPVFADMAAMKAYQSTELVYLDTNNRRIVADSCSPVRDGAKNWPITYSKASCRRRDDFAAKKSYEQAKPVYTRDGLVVSVGDCTDHEPVYPHVMDKDACTASYDLQKKTATELGKWKINTPEGPLHISNCVPTGHGGGISDTIEGCEARHTDYMEASYSRGAERFYHMLTGNRTYVTDCQESTRQYEHDYVGAGWEHDDTKRQSTEKLSVYIDLPEPAGRTLISAASVRDQSPVLPYTEKETINEPTAERTYEGCNEIVQTRKIRVWTRPDGTLFREDTGPGEPLPAKDVCVSSIERKTEYSRSVVSGTDGSLIRFGGGSVGFGGGSNIVLASGPFSSCSARCVSNGGMHDNGCSGGIGGYNHDRTMVRTVRKLADGTTFTGPWKQESEQPTTPIQCRSFVANTLIK